MGESLLLFCPVMGDNYIQRTEERREEKKK
jgi:hypothetical protein